MTIINTLNASGVAKVIAGEEKPTSFPSVYPAPDGYDGWSKMTIEAPDNLTAENIKKDVEIAGITGTYAGGSDGKFAKLCDRTITEVTADDLAGVTSIGHNCFAYCEFLASIDMPDGVTSIGFNCFAYCESLASITIPDGVTSLASYCFSYCTSLASIVMLPTTPPALGSSTFYNTSDDLVITVPKGTLDAYKSATNWSAYADKMVEASE